MRIDGKAAFPVAQDRACLPLIALFGAGATGATRAFLSSTLDGAYDKDSFISGMHSALHALVPARVHKSVPLFGDSTGQATLERIEQTGRLRVGYHPNNLPWSFFNASGELVGYDVDMAHLLALHLRCELEFVPFKFRDISAQLERDDFDLAMSGVTMLPARIAKLRFTEPYIDITAALLVPDHRREEFDQRMVDRDFDDVRIAVGRTSDAAPIARVLMLGAETVTLPSLGEYLTSGGRQADAMIWTSESGGAWTLVHPEFSVAVIRPVFNAPVGYATARHNEEFANFVSSWIQFAKAGGYGDRLYDHWILGKDAQRRTQRWSVIRDVLEWVD